MRPRRFTLLATIAAGAVAAAIVAAVSVATLGDPRTVSRFDHFSNAGTAVSPQTISLQDQQTLTSGGARVGLNTLGSRAGTRFYTAPGAAGGLCFATGAATTGHLGVLACPSPGANDEAAFPSAEEPILNMSHVTFDFDKRVTRILTLAGFAADGVARVGVLDPNGVLHGASVVGNTYSRELPGIEAVALLALDASGGEVYRKRFR